MLAGPPDVKLPASAVEIRYGDGPFRPPARFDALRERPGLPAGTRIAYRLDGPNGPQEVEAAVRTRPATASERTKTLAWCLVSLGLALATLLLVTAGAGFRSLLAAAAFSGIGYLVALGLLDATLVSIPSERVRSALVLLSRLFPFDLTFFLLFRLLEIFPIALNRRAGGPGRPDSLRAGRSLLPRHGSRRGVRLPRAHALAAGTGGVALDRGPPAVRRSADLRRGPPRARPRAASNVPARRRRPGRPRQARLAGWALLGGAGPALLLVAIQAVGKFLANRLVVPPFVMSLAFVPLLVVPFVVVWISLSPESTPAKLLVRRAALFLLARRSVWTACFVPTALLAFHLWLHSDESLGAVLASTRWPSESPRWPRCSGLRGASRFSGAWDAGSSRPRPTRRRSSRPSALARAGRRTSTSWERRSFRRCGRASALRRPGCSFSTRRRAPAGPPAAGFPSSNRMRPRSLRCEDGGSPSISTRGAPPKGRSPPRNARPAGPRRRAEPAGPAPGRSQQPARLCRGGEKEKRAAVRGSRPACAPRRRDRRLPRRREPAPQVLGGLAPARDRQEAAPPSAPRRTWPPRGAPRVSASSRRAGRPLPGRRDAPLPGRRAASPRGAVSLRTPSRRRRDGDGLGGARSRARAVRRCADPARISGGEAARFRREARGPRVSCIPISRRSSRPRRGAACPSSSSSTSRAGRWRRGGTRGSAHRRMSRTGERSSPEPSTSPTKEGCSIGTSSPPTSGSRRTEFPSPRVRSLGRVRRRRRAGVGRRGRRRRPSRALDGADRLAPHPIERDRRNPSVPLSGGGGRQSGRALLRPLGVDVVAYEAVTGRNPFLGGTVHGTLEEIIRCASRTRAS